MPCVRGILVNFRPQPCLGAHGFLWVLMMHYKGKWLGFALLGTIISTTSRGVRGLEPLRGGLVRFWEAALVASQSSNQNRLCSEMSCIGRAEQGIIDDTLGEHLPRRQKLDSQQTHAERTKLLR